MRPGSCPVSAALWSWRRKGNPGRGVSMGSFHCSFRHNTLGDAQSLEGGGKRPNLSFPACRSKKKNLLGRQSSEALKDRYAYTGRRPVSRLPVPKKKPLPFPDRRGGLRLFHLYVTRSSNCRPASFLLSFNQCPEREVEEKCHVPNIPETGG